MRSVLLYLLVTVSACARYRVADVKQAQLDAALTARAQLVYYLVQLGAVEHPPSPPPVWGNEDLSPDTQAVGGPTVAEGGGLEVPFSFSDDVITNPPWSFERAGTRTPREHANTSGWRSALHPEADIRDHRSRGGSGSSSWKSSSSSDGVVRDHRGDDRSSKDDNKTKNDTQDFGGTRFGRPGR